MRGQPLFQMIRVITDGFEDSDMIYSLIFTKLGVLILSSRDAIEIDIVNKRMQDDMDGNLQLHKGLLLFLLQKNV